MSPPTLLTLPPPPPTPVSSLGAATVMAVLDRSYGANTSLAPFPCLWLRPGAVFTGSQNLSSCSLQQREDWDLKATIHQIDLSACKVYGLMEASNMQGSSQPLCQVKTFFEGEVIDLAAYNFWTRQWQATKSTDIKHWRQFEPFARVEQLESHKRPEEIVNVFNEYVFMRWKEMFFVDPDTQAVQLEETYAYPTVQNQYNNNNNHHHHHQQQQQPPPPHIRSERRQRRYQQRTLDYWSLHHQVLQQQQREEQRRRNTMYSINPSDRESFTTPNSSSRTTPLAIPISSSSNSSGGNNNNNNNTTNTIFTPSSTNTTTAAADGMTSSNLMNPLTIQGFYYIVLRKSDGFIEGFYFDPSSTPFQKMQLWPQVQSHGHVFPVYEFA